MPSNGLFLGLQLGYIPDEDWDYNTSMQILDNLSHITVQDYRSAPPVPNSNGMRFLVNADAASEFAGKAQHLAIRAGGQWYFYNPASLRLRYVFVEETRRWMFYDAGSSVWRDVVQPILIGTTFPMASSAYANCLYLKTDENGGTLYYCGNVDESWSWQKAAKGVTESSGAGGGAVLIPSTTGVPAGAGVVDGKHRIEFNETIRRLFIGGNTGWYYLDCNLVLDSIGGIEGLVGWWVVDDENGVPNGAALTSLAGRVGPTWDTTGWSSGPTMVAAALNGKRALQLSPGVSQGFRLPTNPLVGASAAECFFVLKKTGPVTVQASDFAFGTTGAGGHYPYETDGLIYTSVLRNSRPGYSPGAISLTNWHVFRAQSNVNYRITLNGTQVYNNTDGSFGFPANAQMGRSHPDMQIAAVLLFNTSTKAGGVLTSEEYQVVRGWINSFFGLSMT